MVNFKRILLLFLNSKNKIHYISLKNLQSKYSKTYLGIFWFIIRQILKEIKINNSIREHGKFIQVVDWKIN